MPLGMVLIFRRSNSWIISPNLEIVTSNSCPNCTDAVQQTIQNLCAHCGGMAVCQPPE